MPLVLTVSLFVLAVIVIIGTVGYLIDQSEERLERPSTKSEERQP